MSSDIILLSFSLVLSALHHTVGFLLSSQKSLSGTLAASKIVFIWNTVSEINVNCQTQTLALALQLPPHQ